MLFLSVKITKDRPAADVAALAQVGVADVRQVRRPAPRAEAGVFDLGKAAHAAIFAQLRPLPQVRKGPYLAPRPHARAAQHAGRQMRAAAYKTVFHDVAGVQHRLFADDAAAQNVVIGVDDRARADPGAGGNGARLRRKHRVVCHACLLPAKRKIATSYAGSGAFCAKGREIGKIALPLAAKCAILLAWRQKKERRPQRTAQSLR